MIDDLSPRPKARPDVVEELVQRMLAGTQTIRGYTSDELVSAVFTLTARTCGAVMKRTLDEAATREVLTGALMGIMADVMPERKAS